jgi:hypothetical protein
MITLKEKAKLDNTIMSALKVSEIKHVIAHTDKGDLCLNLRFEGKDKDYKFTLDAVPFDDKDNKQLIGLFDGVLYQV